MASIIFIAVQCCQCSMMQVKQKKKSNKKWTCVVCNQKQSVRKIFAQGYMAKDLRKFVQSFNMSRKLVDDSAVHESLTQITSPPFDTGVLEDEDRQRKRRSDWSEYLDAEEDGNKKNIKEGDDGLGIKIVTELPREMFKKPKLRKDHCSQSDTTGDGSSDKLYKPVFSNRNTNRHVFAQGKQENNYQREKVISASKWNDDMMTQDYKEDEGKPTTATKVSKWNAYINHDHDDSNFKVRNGRNYADDEMGQYSHDHDVWETIMNDERVDDDIHPDFI